jgi:DNA-binding response OmpR family regulator
MIAWTGYREEEEERQKSREVGIDLYLLKPTDPLELIGLLERLRQVVR